MKNPAYHILLMASLMTVPLFSAAEEEEEESTDDVQYLELKPGIIANYGAEGGNPRLLNADITLQLMNEDTAETVANYLIPIRHDLIMLFSGLKGDEADNGEKVEALRQRALESVQASLDGWVKDTSVDNLLFTKFVTE